MRAPAEPRRSPALRRGGDLLFELRRSLTKRLTEDLAARIRQRARARAIRRFAWSQPHLYRSYFDDHFLGRLPDDLFGGDPEAVARAWTRQFRYRDEARREQDVRRAEPAARLFLALVEEEERRLI